jgi:hypothetical protein
LLRKDRASLRQTSCALCVEVNTVQGFMALWIANESQI